MDGLDFQLDIEQRLRGGDTVTELERTEAALVDAKQANNDYAKELVRTSAALDKTTASIVETRTALEAAKAAGDTKSIQKYSAELDKLTKSEAKLQAQLKSAQAGYSKSSSSLQSVADQVGRLRNAEKAQEKQSDAASNRNDAMSKKLLGLTGRLGSAASSAAELSEGMGTLGTLATIGVVGIAAVAVAVAAMAVAFVGAVAAIGQYALAMRNAKRDQEQTLRAMTQSDSSAAQLSDEFITIGKNTGVAQDRLLDMTRSLTVARQQMGLAQLSGAQLTKAVYALSLQESALGDSSGTSQLIDQLNSGAISVDRLGDRMNAKYANVVEKKMLGLDQQMVTLQTNLSSIFAKINIEPFLRGLSRLVALLDTSTASGQAIQTLFNDIFGVAEGEQADAFFIVIERGAIKTEIALLNFATQAHKAYRKVNDAISSIDLGPLGSFKDLLVSIASNADPFAGFSAAVTGLTGELMIVEAMVEALSKAYEDGKKWVLKIQGFGTMITMGIRDKIGEGASEVASAVRNLLKGAVDEGKNALDAHSPSRLAARSLGEPIGEGTAQGVENSSDAVAAAVDNMLELPSSPGGGAKSPSNVMSVSGNHYHFNGVKDAEQASELFDDKVLSFFDRLTNQTGGEAPA